MIQTVFLLNLKRPWRPIMEARAEIVSGEKMTWAVLNDASGWPKHLHRRTLLGKGAFFTRLDADNARRGRLEKAMLIPHWVAPHAYDQVRKAMLEYKGTVH